MKVVVIGAGRMAKAAAYDLVRNPKVKKVKIIEEHRKHLSPLKKWLQSKKVVIEEVAVANEKAVAEAIKGYDSALSCVPYKFNYILAKAAITAGVNFFDLGGNNEIVAKELQLHKKAKAKDILIIPDCGLAPGLASVISAKLMSELDKVEEIHLRVGGLPQKPRGILKYALVFSLKGLVNEYIEPVVVLRKGKIKKIKPMNEIEEIVFPKPFGRMEAFTTSGGTSTMPQNLQVKELDYKTIRYPGHCEKIKKLWKESKKNPKKFGEKIKKLVPEGKKDVVLLKAWGIGRKGKKKIKITYTIIDYYDEKTGLTAMMRMTAFPAAIMVTLFEKMKHKGACPQEICAPAALVLRELKKRGIKITRTVT